jgi:hypothetical protein
MFWIKIAEGIIAAFYVYITIKQRLAHNYFPVRIIAITMFCILWLIVTVYVALPDRIGVGTGPFSPLNTL